MLYVTVYVNSAAHNSAHAHTDALSLTPIIQSVRNTDTTSYCRCVNSAASRRRQARRIANSHVE